MTSQSSGRHHIWIPRADGSRQLELLFPCKLHVIQHKKLGSA
jgi:hypothetical protein